MKLITTTLPALSDMAFVWQFNLTALYFAQGIPERILYYGIPA